ncbi:MAG: 1-(5-phosphoribosyl)-5-[(5-phosphoribosylamino)methylideneamino]imidazole-4-carboxamide isomerase [Planctomycetes bacterium]|nr:1-(5-phosphoribosyl)-5-[(5-phosphoribosylamino)methylideneamino]imidazole-4-carboxamide isomerase [Planctomycetota bacterium]
MELLPAIDLRDGKVVRLRRGDYDDQTVYGDDPAAIAARFEQAGARWIHVVDLDAAKSGVLTNGDSIRAIRRAVKLSIELGGGARSDKAVDAMIEAGADRVVVGSAAMRDWAWFERLARRDDLAAKVALGLDAREGMLAAHGWTEQTTLRAVDMARRVNGWPLGAIVYTDIARDGMLQGVNIEATGEIVRSCDVPVIASGGVTDIDDIRRCRQIGCGGAIVGKAWYDGRIDLARAFAAASETCD